VKGLAAVKVTSLFDAFSKPFLVGGLHRPEEAKGKGKERAVDPTTKRVDGPGAEETDPIGSPEWPDERDDVEEGSRSLARGRVPSRSPGVSPEQKGGGDGDGGEALGNGAWHDPLEDEEDEEDEDEGDGEDGEVGDGPAPKRARVDL